MQPVLRVLHDVSFDYTKAVESWNTFFYSLVLARAIHSLAKIGDELHISPMENGLTLKTVNASKSAYSAFNFHLPFFLDYTHISENTVQADTEEDTVIKCKLPMKVWQITLIWSTVCLRCCFVSSPSCLYLGRSEPWKNQLKHVR